MFHFTMLAHTFLTCVLISYHASYAFSHAYGHAFFLNACVYFSLSVSFCAFVCHHLSCWHQMSHWSKNQNRSQNLMIQSLTQKSYLIPNKNISSSSFSFLKTFYDVPCVDLHHFLRRKIYPSTTLIWQPFFDLYEHNHIKMVKEVKILAAYLTNMQIRLHKIHKIIKFAAKILSIDKNHLITMFAVSELPTTYYRNWNNGSRIRCIHINLFDPLQHIISNDKLAKNSVLSGTRWNSIYH